MRYDILIAILIFYPMVGALISYLIGLKSKTARNLVANLVAISEFAVAAFTVLSGYGLVNLFVSSLAAENQTISPVVMGTFMDFQLNLPEICGMGLHFTLDGFRCVYVLVVSFMWMMVTILCPEYFVKHHNRNRFYTFLLVTLGATMGVRITSSFILSLALRSSASSSSTEVGISSPSFSRRSVRMDKG